MLERAKSRSKGFLIVFFLFFFFLGFISLGFVWDFSKVIMARHQAYAFADTLSMAGVSGVRYESNRIVVDPTEARKRVRDTYFAGLSADVISNTSAPFREGVWVPSVPSTSTPGNSTVIVTVPYRVCGLYIVGILANRSTCFNGTISSVTELCSSANGDNCAYPLRL